MKCWLLMFCKANIAVNTLDEYFKLRIDRTQERGSQRVFFFFFSIEGLMPSQYVH